MFDVFSRSNQGQGEVEGQGSGQGVPEKDVVKISDVASKPPSPPPLPKETRVYVGNLPRPCNKPHLMKFIEMAGKIMQCENHFAENYVILVGSSILCCINFGFFITFALQHRLYEIHQMVFKIM